MFDETIVAVYDTPAHAQLAVADIEVAGVPVSAISQHANPIPATAAQAETVREPGFWSRLFGGEVNHDHTVYDRSLQAGSTVVTVKIAEAQAAQVMEILESHQPIDIDERASGYGLTGSATVRSVTGDTRASGPLLFNRGSPRVRHYVAEPPVDSDRDVAQ